MSTKFRIDGCPVDLVIRSLDDRKYTLYFDREVGELTLAQLKKINWARPTIDVVEPKKPGEIYLPEGYGFHLEKLAYNSHPDQWMAEVKVADEYLGDVTGYQAKIADMDQQLLDAASKNHELERQLAEADELAISLYEENLASQKTGMQEVAEK